MQVAITALAELQCTSVTGYYSTCRTKMKPIIVTSPGVLKVVHETKKNE